MRREAVLEGVKLNSLGEIRMGCEAYGVIIETNFGHFDIFKDVPMLIGHEDYSKHIEQSKCHRYLLLKGEFGVYICDIKDQSISVYQTTIRGATGEWSKEQAIFGREKTQVDGFSHSYYLQFPFVRQSAFYQILGKYEALRKQQIETAINAF